MVYKIQLLNVKHFIVYLFIYLFFVSNKMFYERLILFFDYPVSILYTNIH